MTPEREAQMREMFQKWAKDFGFPLTMADAEFAADLEYTRAAMQGWLACDRALEQFSVDAYDLGWLSCVEWSGRDDLAADMQSPAYLNLRNLRLKALAEKPNAAMSAALEDGNATE